MLHRRPTYRGTDIDAPLKIYLDELARALPGRDKEGNIYLAGDLGKSVFIGDFEIGNYAIIRRGNIVLPKTSGVGIKVDVANPSFGWRDLLGETTARNTGASKPTLAIYRGGLRQYQFGVGDEEFYDFHIPHDYVAGTDILIHIHWSHTSALVTGGSIVFEIEVSYAKGHGQAAFSAPVEDVYSGNASTTQYVHAISETQLSSSAPTGFQLNTADLEPDGVIMMRVGVNQNNITVSSGGVPDPYLHFADVHYQSTNMATKDKVPDFYT